MGTTSLSGLYSDSMYTGWLHNNNDILPPYKVHIVKILANNCLTYPADTKQCYRTYQRFSLKRAACFASLSLRCVLRTLLESMQFRKARVMCESDMFVL